MNTIMFSLCMKHNGVPKCLRIYMQDYVSFNVMEEYINYVLNKKEPIMFQNYFNTRESTNLQLLIDHKIFGHMVKYYKNTSFYDIKFDSLFLEQFDDNHISLTNFKSFVDLHHSYLHINSLIGAYFQNLINRPYDKKVVYDLYKFINGYINGFYLIGHVTCDITKNAICGMHLMYAAGENDDFWD